MGLFSRQFMVLAISLQAPGASYHYTPLRYRPGISAIYNSRVVEAMPYPGKVHAAQTMRDGSPVKAIQQRRFR